MVGVTGWLPGYFGSEILFEILLKFVGATGWSPGICFFPFPNRHFNSYPAFLQANKELKCFHFSEKKNTHPFGN